MEVEEGGGGRVLVTLLVSVEKVVLVALDERQVVLAAMLVPVVGV